MSDYIHWDAMVPGIFGGSVVQYGGGSLLNDGTLLVGMAPIDALGGGVTIGSAVLWNDKAVTAIEECQLITLSSAGALSGTIGTIVGALTANVPKAFTINDAWVDGGEYIALTMGTVTASQVGLMKCCVQGKIGK